VLEDPPQVYRHQACWHVLHRYFIIKNNLSERVLRQQAIAMNNLATPRRFSMVPRRSNIASFVGGGGGGEAED